MRVVRVRVRNAPQCVRVVLVRVRNAPRCVSACVRVVRVRSVERLRGATRARRRHTAGMGDGRAPNKTVPTDRSVAEFLDAVPDERRRAEAWTVLELVRQVTGLEPAMWGPSIVGFGTYHYRYPTGREGDMPLAGFSPRKAAMTVYLTDGVEAHADALARLGPHKVGKGCLYLAHLDRVDLGVLEDMVRQSYRSLTEHSIMYHQAERGSGQRST